MYTCPACGFGELYEPPRSATSGGGSYEICPSCGYEFGVSDDDLGITYAEWRQQWVQSGMRWQSVGRHEPPVWDPQAQLRRLETTQDGN